MDTATKPILAQSMIACALETHSAVHMSDHRQAYGQIACLPALAQERNVPYGLAVRRNDSVFTPGMP